MRISFTILFIISSIVSIAQVNYEIYHLKEHFDNLYTSIYQNPTVWTYDTMHNDPGIPTKNDQADHLSSFRAPAMDGLLEMYETTDDKAYLYAFMKEATKIIKLRRDINLGSNYAPIWFRWKSYSNTNDPSGNAASAAFNGRITVILARFVHLVKLDWDLSNTTINLRPAYSGIPNEDRMTLYNGSTTFGEYADWVEEKVDETLTWALAYNPIIGKQNFWVTNAQGCFQRTGVPHGFANVTLGEFNYQSPWANTFLYMYLLDASKYYNYGVHAVKIAQLILNNSCNQYSTNVLEYDGPTDSYYWYHHPWWGPAQGPSHPDSYMEDLGHATWDIQFPLLYNRFESSITNHVTTGQYFQDYQLARFRNTFSRKIYDPNYISGGLSYSGFHMGVNGTTWGAFSGSWATYNFNDTAVRNNAMCYMPLQKFDNYPGNVGLNVYNILMDTYWATFRFKGNLFSYQRAGGLIMKGWADMVTAQWEHECFSLYLNNRDFYYDETIYARKNLMVGYPKTLLQDVYQFPSKPTDVYPHTAIGNQDFNLDKIIVRDEVHLVLYASNDVFIKAGAIEVQAGGKLTIKYVNNLHEEQDAITVLGDGEVERLNVAGTECEVIPEMLVNNNDNSAERGDTETRSINNIDNGQLGSSETELGNNISIYPNPTKHESKLWISTPNHKDESLKFQVYNQLGMLVLEGTTGNEKTEIDLIGLNPGLYYVNISNLVNQLYKGKFIIE